MIVVADCEPHARTRAFCRAMGFEDHRRELNPGNPECPEALCLRQGIGKGRSE